MTIIGQTTWWEIGRGQLTNYFWAHSAGDERSQDSIQGILWPVLGTRGGAYAGESIRQLAAVLPKRTDPNIVQLQPDGPYHWFKVNWIIAAIGIPGKEKGRQDPRERGKSCGEGAGFKKLLYVHFYLDDNT